VAKLIILSVLLMSVGLPGWFAARAQPRKALRQVQRLVIVYVVVWGYLCLHVYPQLVELK
jgi:hypothetical protein